MLAITTCITELALPRHMHLWALLHVRISLQLGPCLQPSLPAVSCPHVKPMGLSCTQVTPFVTLEPCGHTNMCAGCTRGVMARPNRECPTCRMEISGFK